MGTVLGGSALLAKSSRNHNVEGFTYPQDEICVHSNFIHV